MGTTAEKLQAVLDSKNAIKTKFNLPDDLPFSQYAENINPSGGDTPSGGALNFYQCKSITYEESYPDYYDMQVVVQNASAGTVTSPFVLERKNLQAVGRERFWSGKDPGGTNYSISYEYTLKCWQFFQNGSLIGSVDDATGNLEFTRSVTFGGIGDLTAQIQEIINKPGYEGVRKWVGVPITYGADGFIVDEAGQEQLFFTENRIVQVGHIYNEDATVEAAWLYKKLEPTGKYLCSYVNRNYMSYDVLVVSGMPTNAFVGGKYYDSDWNQQDLPADVASRNPNGVYTLTKKGDERYPTTWVWQAENGCILKGHSMEPGFQIIPGEYNDLNRYIYFVNYDGVEYPSKGYASYTWTWNDGSSYPQIQGGSVAPQKPEPVEQYWEGYKLYQDENGKWCFEAEKTKLAYGDYMPVPGRVYDAMPTMEILNLDWADEFLQACPTNMTSDEDDVWKISTNGQLYDGQLWYMFTGEVSADRNCMVHYVANMYIQWQNKKHPVMLKELVGAPGGGDWGYYWDYYTFNVLGSNDGEVWDTLYSGKWDYDGSWGTMGGYEAPKRKIAITGNFGPYSYYRIVRNDTSNGSAWNSHYYGAVGQLSREVPE